MLFKSILTIATVLLSVDAFGKLSTKTTSNNPFAKSNDPMLSSQGPIAKSVNLNGGTTDLVFGKTPVKQIVAALNDPTKTTNGSQATFNPNGPSIYAPSTDFLTPVGLSQGSDFGNAADTEQ